MGSSGKKHKERDSRKRRHRSPSNDYNDGSPKDKRHKHRPSEDYEDGSPKEKRHKRRQSEEYEDKERKHKHHHKHRHRREKDKKKEKSKSNYVSDDSDVIEISADESSQKDSPQNTEVENGKSSDSLSIEETNKLRAKLGLKPLDLAPSNAPSTSKSDGKYKDDWGEFYHKPADNWANKAQQEKLKTKLSEKKEKRELMNKYSKVKTLGQSDSEDDADSWVNKNRKIEEAKKEAERRAKMLEELDAQFGIGEVIESEERERRRQKYTSKNLKGLKVDHDIDDIAEQRNIILTLKDQGVLEDEEDVLVNVNMVDDERYKKNLENKKKKGLQEYQEEFDQFGNPIEKSLLSKYDEEIEGEKRDSFKLGTDITFEGRKQQAMSEAARANLTKKKLERIAETELKLASEYYNEEEMSKFKKPRKKVRKLRPKGQLSADDLEKTIDNTGIEAVGSRRPKYKVKPEDLKIDDTPEVEVPEDFAIDEKDDSLEQALHRARKIKQKENVAAELVKEIIVKTEVKQENLDTGNIVLNATAEFCRTLGDIPTYGKSGNRDQDEELDMELENDLKEEEDSDEDVQIIEHSGWNSVDLNQDRKIPEKVPQEVQILDEEPDVSKGMAAALKVAMSKGYLEKELNNRPSNSRLAHLQAQHYSIEDKVYGDDGERGARRGERFTGPIQDFKEKDGFKPNVKLEYIDDEGHLLNSKEAFRYLSHKFHGKGPGKNKVEKRIKKGVQEQLMKKMSSTDTPLGTLNMLQAKQKESQSPFVVLSGNKQSQNTMISKISRR